MSRNRIAAPILAITLSLMLAVTGCTFASAMSQLQTWAPVGLTAFTGIVSILNPAVGSPLAVWSGRVIKVWGDMQAGIRAYNDAPAANKATRMGELLTVLDAVQGELKQGIADLGANPSSVDVQAAQAALLLLQTTLATIEAKLAPKAPAPVAATHTQHTTEFEGARTVRVNKSTLTIGPVTSGSDFKKQFNVIMQHAGLIEYQLR
jgi:hypothetical protein